MDISMTDADTNRLVDDALLRLAYKNSNANILVNVTAGLGLSLIVMEYTQHPADLAVWWGLLTVVTVIRLGFALSFKRLHPEGSELTRSQWRKWAAIHPLGLACALLLWIFMTHYALSLPQSEAQFSALIVVAALAAGATGILAPLAVTGQAYIAVMLLQAAAQLMMMPEPPLLLAALACVFLIVMIVAIRNNHAVLRRSLIYQHHNETLIRELELERNSLEARVKDRTAELQHQAEHDRLTGLFNREGLEAWLRNTRIAESERVAVMFLDLDHFKQINDGMGHAVGDKVLITVAERLRLAIPKKAALCRWGGDEFVLVSPVPKNRSKATVNELLKRVRRGVEAPLDIAGSILHVSFSAGVSLPEPDSFSLAAAIRAADLAAAEVKRNGRGSACFYCDELAVTQERKLRVAQALKGALDREEFSVVFQPVVDAASGEIEAHEALVRWTCPELGPVGPDEFIAIAEDTGDIAEIGGFVLERAISTLAEADPTGRTKVAVNSSLRQLIRPDFIIQVETALNRCKLSADRLVIEVTESIFESRNLDTIRQTLVHLSWLGVGIHLDDFGTGYSSLSRLHEMPISCIKIDKSFVRRLDKHAVAIIEASVLISHKLGIHTIAEGVETEEQAIALRLMGVQAFQGYLYGRPAAALQIPRQDQAGAISAA